MSDKDDELDIGALFGDDDDDRGDDLPSSSLGSSADRSTSRDSGADGGYNPFDDDDDDDDIFGSASSTTYSRFHDDDDDDDVPRGTADNDYIDHSKSSKFGISGITSKLKENKKTVGIVVAAIIVVFFVVKFVSGCGGDSDSGSGTVNDDSSVSTEDSGGSGGVGAPKYRPIPPEDGPVNSDEDADVVVESDAGDATVEGQ